MLGQGAVVLLITDGLDREARRGLAEEMERLHKSCRRLIWLNPLLRYEGYEPRSLGNKAMMPHVDEFRPVHNLESLAGLVARARQPARAGSAGQAARAMAGRRELREGVSTMSDALDVLEQAAAGRAPARGWRWRR